MEKLYGELIRCIIISIVLYLQSECIESTSWELCSKYDRGYDFDVIHG